MSKGWVCGESVVPDLARQRVPVGDARGMERPAPRTRVIPPRWVARIKGCSKELAGLRFGLGFRFIVQRNWCDSE